jgi:hypothetical protein
MKSTSSATWLGAEAKAYPYLGVRLYCVNHENNETLTIHGAADVKALSESSGKISVYDLIKQAKWIVKKTDKGTYDIDSYYEKNPQPK